MNIEKPSRVRKRVTSYFLSLMKQLNDSEGPKVAGYPVHKEIIDQVPY